MITKGRRQSHHACSLAGDKSGVTLDIYSELCALQVYDGSGLAKLAGKDGATYGPYAGIALETQFSPDAIHHPAFSQPICTPDRPFQRRVIYAFGVA